MKLIDRLLRIDRRIIFLVIGGVVLIPLILPFELPMRAMHPVKRLYDAVDTIPKGKILMISVDYDPQVEPELQPMCISLLRHAFSRRIPVAVLSLFAMGIGLAEDALTTVAEEFNSRAETPQDSIISGRDYVFLGMQPPPLVPILGMGESITRVFPRDYYGNQTDTLPMMQTVKNYNEVGLLISLSGSAAPAWWVAYAQSRFGVKVGAGVTAVIGADFYPYLQTGQFSGLMVGMKGGAEYEKLVRRNFMIEARRRATEAMSSQTAAHLAIMAFIIIGNLAFFITRRRRG